MSKSTSKSNSTNMLELSVDELDNVSGGSSDSIDPILMVISNQDFASKESSKMRGDSIPQDSFSINFAKID